MIGWPFVKMSGGGNDFVLFDNRGGDRAPTPEAIASVCERGTGVGADAVLLVEEDERADVRMVYYNADGGRAPMCGNGAMCLARYARLEGIATGPDVVIATDAGLVRARVPDPTRTEVELELTTPGGLVQRIPACESNVYERVGFLDTTTPHVVVQTANVLEVDVANAGRRLRNDDRWAPDGTNVNFISVRDRSTLRMRTYERGVEAETLSCGTGATAAAILTWLWGLTDVPIVVETSGGIPITVDFEPVEPGRVPNNPRMAGQARIVFRGVIGEVARIDRQDVGL